MNIRAGYFIIVLAFLKSEADAQVVPKRDHLPVIKVATALPQNYYTTRLSFFCKKEWQLQKLTGTNLFLRLGTKEYVDYLEQKPGAVKRY